MNNLLHYNKIKNEELFEYLEKSELKLNNLQNYIPIYEKFFNLNESNFNNINLNQKYTIDSISNIIDRNNISGILLDSEKNNKIKKNIFIKFSPLLDPLKYLTGKYDVNCEKTFKLPSINNNEKSIPKLYDTNNSAYIDGFFTYLSSLLLHKFDFINGLDYYGSYLANKDNFYYNIVDDIDYLNESSFFHENKDSLFSIDNEYYNDLFNVDSRCKKHKLNISDNSIKIETEDLLQIDIENNNSDCNIDSDKDLHIVNLNELNLETNCIFNFNKSKSNTRTTCSNSESSYSSKSSNTDIDNDSDCNDGEIDDDESSINTSDISSDCSSEEDIYISINKFPTQLICLEKCENTLDDLMINNKLNNDQWISALMQVNMMLITYQNVFSFTHNDLHTNNIMYNTTDKKNIYYIYNNKKYRVPTYGKIFKIIDYGRAIYKFKGDIMCSDSFHPKGDAATQYNCEPYFDEKKPRLDPNYSFDLCRLGCCLFDYFVDELSEINTLVKKNQLIALINDWVKDDKNRNVLYKTNGDERYPEFKLYKMIARTVHNNLPEKQLEKKIFSKFLITDIPKKQKVINIDKIPKMI